MLKQDDLNMVTNIAYCNYHAKPKEFLSGLKHKRIKDNFGFLADLYFDVPHNIFYICFQGINQNTLKSGYFKNNMKTGGAYQYSENFAKVKFWSNAFCKHFSSSSQKLKIKVIGHSMGGAVAQMFVSDILYKNIFDFSAQVQNIQLVTFNGLGGTIGNYFLNTNLSRHYNRNSKYNSIVKRLWRQVETYHFVHKDDIVAKILEHENKQDIYILGLEGEKSINAFHGEINAHDMDVFYDMVKKKQFNPQHCQHSHFEQFNLKDFLHGWLPIVSLFYLLMFKAGENSVFNWFSIPHYYKKYQQAKSIRVEVLKKFRRMKERTKPRDIVS